MALALLAEPIEQDRDQDDGESGLEALCDVDRVQRPHHRLAQPVGAHERYNREWLLENGAALEPEREAIGPWLRAKRADGTLARAARAGEERLPKRGLYRIVERVTANGPPARPV